MTTWYPEGYGSDQKYYYPPGPPPLSAATSNPNPPTWRGYQHTNNSDSSKTSSRAQSQASVPLVPPVHSHTTSPGHPQLDLMDGVDYFKIGDMVRIRRWTPDTDSFTDWAVGQVVRPLLVENEDGTQRRSYLCSYEHGRNKERKEREFSPHYHEIASLVDLEVDSVPSVPDPRLGNGDQLVFAPIPLRDISGSHWVMYWPAIVLTAPDEQGMVRIRVLAGPAAKREIDKFSVKQALPYNAESAQILGYHWKRMVAAARFE
ncbi:hypothetical protein B0H12DRAFT_1068675 [Mycena haematopus]|nr:hypothetical protein B0H12DRAFT_1068675 [Mycena haematopus]